VKVKFNKSVLLSVLICFGLISCKKEEVFTVEGSLSSAVGDTLYLEHRGLSGPELLDSIVLGVNGTFKLSQPAPQNPEFYQLRIKDQVVTFAIDSTETLKISADAQNLYQTFKVENSYVNDLLREVDLLTAQVSTDITNLNTQHDKEQIDDMEYINRFDSLLTNYKSNITGIIIGNPSSAAAYYAVFQKINDFLIFDPYEKTDYAMFGAVATSWNRFYPETERTKHLNDFTMTALQTRRRQEQQAKLLESVPLETEAQLPDIVLYNENGERVALSELKGKVVLLDFIVYSGDFSPKHNMDLNSLYNRFKSSDLEIYQISFDSNEHFWKTSASNLPWITVRHPQSVNAGLLSTYNIREIPTSFIVNREGDIVARIDDYTQLLDELNKVL